MLDPQLKINILCYSGARLYQAAKYADKKLKQQMPEQVYVLAGINNLTIMDKKTRQVSIVAPDKDVISQHVSDEINFAYASLRKSTNTRTKIIFAPITGMSIAHYNNIDPDICKEEQHTLDQAILDINQRIVSFNEEKGNKTPWTHAIIHRYFRRKYHFDYDRLDSDGCHLTDEVRSFWLRKISTAIIANTDIVVRE